MGVGWVDSRSADEVYGSGLLLSTLYQEIAKVRYPGLDLRHLRGDQGAEPAKATM